MTPLPLHEFHGRLGARFTDLNGAEVVNDYGDWPAEHAALRNNAAVLDLSFRGRICLVGSDRVRFLHGQVTNDVKKLVVGSGCYAALVTAKGRMESDLNIFCLADELLLDFEPGLAGRVTQRLERFIVADDVQIVDAAPHYGLLSVQGPQAEEVVRALGWGESPREPRGSIKISDSALGEIYLVNHPRLAMRRSRGNEAQFKIGNRKSEIRNESETPPVVSCSTGFDLFIPNSSLASVADKLIGAAKSVGGRAAGWQAFETARLESGIPRFGVDMDESNLPLECGIEERAVSYHKGCYIGQEVINRVHSFGHVNRELRGLRLADDLRSLPQKGDKLFHDGKEIGYVTSAVQSPVLGGNLALGYVRREANQIGTELTLRMAAGDRPATIVPLPFVRLDIG